MSQISEAPREAVTQEYRNKQTRTDSLILKTLILMTLGKRKLKDIKKGRVAEVQKYIFDCCFEFGATPESPDESALQVDPLREDKDEAYDDFGSGGAIDFLSELVALPVEGGLFPVADYVGPELAAYAFAEPPACDD